MVQTRVFLISSPPAFLLDYKPSERPKYIDAFFSNIGWEAVERRLLKAKENVAAAR
jgi:superoxide dismutase